MQSILRNSQMEGDRAGGKGTGIPGLVEIGFRNTFRLIPSLDCLLASVIFLSAAVSHAQSDLPDGAGKAVVQRMCTQCHGVNVITGQRMTRPQWAEQVDDMVSRGAV